MKVAYISSPYFFDMDLSLVQKLKEKYDLYYIIELPSYAKSSTALSIKTSKKAGIYPALDFQELQEFFDFIDLTKTFILYRTSKQTYALSNIRLQFKIISFLRKINADIIHCNGLLKFNFLFFLIFNKTPKVLTIHDPFPHSGENSEKVQFIRKINLYFFKNFILLNKAQKKEFSEKEKIPLDKIFISKLGAYTYLDLYKSKEQIIPNKNRLIFFGRISPYKGIEELCQAILKVREFVPEIELIVAGSGEFWFDISYYQSLPNFKFINRYITTQELVELLNSSQLVICPYKDATQSGVIMTAFGMNKPVLATKVGGLEEMVKNKITGSLIEPNNIEELTDEIIRLVQNPEIIKEMEENIRLENQNGERSWNSIADGLIKNYKKILRSN